MKKAEVFLKKWWPLLAFLFIAFLFGREKALVSHLQISMILIVIIGVAGVRIVKLPVKDDEE